MQGIMLSLLVLKTRQMYALRTFYGSLGIQMTQEQHGKGPVHFAGEVGNVVLEVYPLTGEGTQDDTMTRLGFSVPNLTQVVASVKAVGGQVITEPQSTEWGLRAVVRDPDGRTVELYQR